ncbi:myosin regulatory light chain interacting protein [Homalodisca vitripennis]|nr:myosin regulatory light chain interacting protein [Homalodisca vitripennis]
MNMICMDASIDTVFFPCAHVVACSECAVRCASCPLCRANILESKRVYLPTLDHDFRAPAAVTEEKDNTQ